MNRMNTSFKFSLPLFTILTCLAWPQLSHACKVLQDVQAADTIGISADEIRKCIERGGDAPFHLRRDAGLDISDTPDAAGGLRMGGCGVDNVCVNAERERTETYVAGANPANNPNLNLPEVAWKDMTTAQIPCGAVGTLAEIALQTLWGNVSLNLPPAATTLLNNKLNGLLGNLFKKADCSDGTFWGLLNTVLNVVLPGLGINQGGGFVFNVQNSTFIAPSGAILAMPIQSTFSVDLSLGNASFDLPAGGNFTDVNGTIVNIAPGGSVQFNSNGNVTLNSGKTFQVPPMSVINFDPHGAVSIPPGSVVPVPPNATLFPMAPATKAPAWAKNI